MTSMLFGVKGSVGPRAAGKALTDFTGQAPVKWSWEAALSAEFFGYMSLICTVNKKAKSDEKAQFMCNK